MALTPTTIALYAGEDVLITGTLTPLIDITGWSLVFTARKALGSTTALITKTTGSGIVITDAVNGVFTISLASAETLAAGEGQYPFDVQRSDTGLRRVLAIGTLNVAAEVSL